MNPSSRKKKKSQQKNGPPLATGVIEWSFNPFLIIIYYNPNDYNVVDTGFGSESLFP